MSFDSLLMVLEILLLIWIVWQGEAIRYYERETYRMNRDRYEERKKWRQEKQEQTRKKLAQKTSDSNTNMASPLPTGMLVSESKTVDVNVVA